MSKREAKRLERRAFEKGIVATVLAINTGVLGYEYWTGTLGVVGTFLLLFMCGACIKGGLSNGSL